MLGGRGQRERGGKESRSRSLAFFQVSALSVTLELWEGSEGWCTKFSLMWKVRW